MKFEVGFLLRVFNWVRSYTVTKTLYKLQLVSVNVLQSSYYTFNCCQMCLRMGNGKPDRPWIRQILKRS